MRYDLLPDDLLYSMIHHTLEREQLVFQSKYLLLTGECSSDVVALLMRHPLWNTCIQLSLMYPSLESIICGIPEWHSAQLYASATLIVTIAGRSVVQKRRAGFQDFGGGTYPTSFFTEDA